MAVHLTNRPVLSATHNNLEREILMKTIFTADVFGTPTPMSMPTETFERNSGYVNSKTPPKPESKFRRFLSAVGEKAGRASRMHSHVLELAIE